VLSNSENPEVWATINKFLELTTANNYFQEKTQQNEYWMLETINAALKLHFMAI
jgi:LAO/AO transport system kinase